MIFFDLRENVIVFFRDYSFLLSEAKYKAKYNLLENALIISNSTCTSKSFNKVIKQNGCYIYDSESSKISDPHRL